MRTCTTTLALAAAALLTLTACQDTTQAGSDSTSESKAPAPASPGSNDDAKPAALPNMVGKGLQSAQDQAQAAGFYVLKSHDSLGRARNQVLDRQWKVCTQTPKAGEHLTDTTVDFGTVKLTEDCPSADQGEPKEAGGTMPDFAGKSVKAARQALDSSTSLTVADLSGESRMVLMESNWKVCGQDPKAGSKLDGQPVTLTAVKFEESC
ncbi:PASTA domain-containing protein [Streptomyces sp. ISL-96]|uniref:PASTA domain-containing protein n=1 Tax=Streptomyces sp. ISL-96 TaxID=2819191 RepID=UPI001BE9EF6F|nr:PASTA domain-containing protein [Streptomyces sp. ISL-96]MBT2491596.1 PASTA domain-containing protein [Streptomyces sp. ISL-96]